MKQKIIKVLYLLHQNRHSLYYHFALQVRFALTFWILIVWVAIYICESQHEPCFGLDFWFWYVSGPNMRTLIFHKGLSCTENYGGKISKIYLGVDLTSFLEVFCASLKSPLRSESEDGLKICVKCARAQIVARTLQRAKNQKSVARAYQQLSV